MLPHTSLTMFSSANMGNVRGKCSQPPSTTLTFILCGVIWGNLFCGDENSYSPTDITPVVISVHLGGGKNKSKTKAISGGRNVALQHAGSLQTTNSIRCLACLRRCAEGA